jgi:hypothetical protein
MQLSGPKDEKRWNVVKFLIHYLKRTYSGHIPGRFSGFALDRHERECEGNPFL